MHQRRPRKVRQHPRKVRTSSYQATPLPLTVVKWAQDPLPLIALNTFHFTNSYECIRGLVAHFRHVMLYYYTMDEQAGLVLRDWRFLTVLAFVTESSSSNSSIKLHHEVL